MIIMYKKIYAFSLKNTFDKRKFKFIFWCVKFNHIFLYNVTDEGRGVIFAASISNRLLC